MDVEPVVNVMVEPRRLTLTGAGDSGVVRVRGFTAAGFAVAVGARIAVHRRLAAGQQPPITVEPVATGWRVTALAEVGAARLVITVGELAAEVVVGIGTRTVRLAGPRSQWTLRTARATGSLSGPAAEPLDDLSRGGDPRPSLTVDYDFTGSTATRAVYLDLDEPVPVPGQPLRLAVDIVADGRGAWPSLDCRDAEGTQVVLRGEHLDGVGQRGCPMAVPPGTVHPLRLHGFYLAETRPDQRYRGRIGVGAITAEVPVEPEAAVGSPAESGSVVVLSQPADPALTGTGPGQAPAEPAAQAGFGAAGTHPVPPAGTVPAEPVAPAAHGVPAPALFSGPLPFPVWFPAAEPDSADCPLFTGKRPMRATRAPGCGPLFTDDVSTRTWRFAVVSDTQFVASDPPDRLVPVAREVLRDIRAADVDLVIVAGDFVDAGSPADLALATTILAEELADGPPWHYVPGNHEIAGGDIATFSRYFGAERRVFDHRGIRFVTIYTSSLRVGVAQFAWLRGELARAADDAAVTAVVVVGHVPPHDPTGHEASRLVDRGEAEELERTLADFAATGKGCAYVAGHAGCFATWLRDGVAYLVNGNSGKDPAAPPHRGGVLGWSECGVDPPPGRNPAESRRRVPDWLAVRVRRS